MGRILEKSVAIEELAFDELTESELELVAEAKKAAERAYAPYSRFRVGAVLEFAAGGTVSGNNQENAAYPSGLCAERVAIFYAGANFPDSSPKRLVVYARGEGGELEEPAMPCGSCLQALWQYEKRFGASLAVYLVGKNKVYKANGIKMLLPFAFNSI